MIYRQTFLELGEYNGIKTLDFFILFVETFPISTMLSMTNHGFVVPHISSVFLLGTSLLPTEDEKSV